MNKLKSSVVESVKKICRVIRGQRQKKLESNLVVDGGSSKGNTEQEDGFQELAEKSSRYRTQSSLQNDMQRRKESSSNG